MKKIIKLALILITSNVFSQKISEIEYGERYNNLKEISYYDFKDQFSSTSNKEILLAYTRGMRAPESFAFSNFSTKFKKINSKYGNIYIDQIEEEITDKNYMNTFFLNGISKKSYTYLMLLLKKFESLTEYQVNLYNYRLDREEMLKEVHSKTQKIKDSISNLESAIELNISNDNILEDLRNNKEESLSLINSNFDDKKKIIENKINTELKKLPTTNYAFNKNKIIEKYNPAIEMNEIERNNNLETESKNFDNQIVSRQKIINEKIGIETSKLKENEKSILENEIKAIKDKYNLDIVREKFENDYENSKTYYVEQVNSLL